MVRWSVSVVYLRSMGIADMDVSMLVSRIDCLMLLSHRAL